jgi:hypothetical protein
MKRPNWGACQLSAQSECLRGGAYVLLHILLAGVHGALAHLEAQLGRGVVDEAAERGRYVAAVLLAGHAMLRLRLLLLLLLCVAIAALGLRRRLGRRGRAQLRDGRDVLGHGVVERRRVRGRRVLVHGGRQWLARWLHGAGAGVEAAGEGEGESESEGTNEGTNEGRGVPCRGCRQRPTQRAPAGSNISVLRAPQPQLAFPPIWLRQGPRLVIARPPPRPHSSATTAPCWTRSRS